MSPACSRRISVATSAFVAFVLLSGQTIRANDVVSYQKEKLTPGPAPPADEFGRAVSISDDGTVALVLSKHQTECGIAHLYARSGQAWVLQQSITLPPNTPPVTSSCSSGVLSGDGKTLLVQEYNDNTAWVFVRDVNAWNLQATLVPPPTPGVNKALFNFPLALSKDGKTAFIASFGDAPCGVAFVYHRNGSAWSAPQELTITATGCEQATALGLALSGNGTTAVIGVGGDDCLVEAKCGSAYVFVRDGDTWMQQQQLSPGQAQTSGWFGRAIALSDDGHTVVVGAPQEWNLSSNPTSAFVYTRVGTSWSLQQQLSVPGGGNLGVSVDLSGDGETALVGIAEYPCAICSRVLVFSRAGTSWSLQHTLEGESGDYFGVGTGRVALSADAATLIVGAPAAAPEGAAWVFTGKCHPATKTLDPDCFELPTKWVEVGCEIVDCCNLCPLASLIDWIIRVDGDPVQNVVLRFENLDPRAARSLRLEGDAKWIGPDRLQLNGRGVFFVRGFRVLDPRNLRRTLLSPRMSLDGIETLRPSDASGPVNTSASRSVAVRIRVEQRIGQHSIAHSTLVYRRR